MCGLFPLTFQLAKLSHPLISYYLCSLEKATKIHSAFFSIAVKWVYSQHLYHRVIIKLFKIVYKSPNKLINVNLVGQCMTLLCICISIMLTISITLIKATVISLRLLQSLKPLLLLPLSKPTDYSLNDIKNQLFQSHHFSQNCYSIIFLGEKQDFGIIKE